MRLASRWIRTTFFYIAAFFQGFCLIIIPAASIIFKAVEFGALTDRQYGLSFLPMNLTAVLVTLAYNSLLRRYGRQALLNGGMAGLGGYCAAVWGAAQASYGTVFLWLLGANLSLGVGFGLLISTANLAMVELHPDKRDVMLMGMHGFLGMGAALAPLAVEFFYAQKLWPLSHGIYLAVWIILAVVIFILKPSDYCGPELAVKSSCGLDQENPLRMPRQAWFFLGAVFFYGVAESITGNWSTLFLTQNKGFSFQTAARALSAFWIFLTIGRILAAVAALKVDPRLLYRISPVGMCIALFYLCFFKSEQTAVNLYCLIGFTCSYFFPLSIGLATQYHPQYKDTLSSYAIAAIMAGVSVGTTLLGVLQDAGVVNIQVTFITAAACALLLAILNFKLTRPAIAK